MFNIITRRTLNEYITKYPDAADALVKWYLQIIDYDFKSFNELKFVFSTASLVADDRVVFNIKGNDYRLVVRFSFKFKSIQIKWFGTHKEYDKINVETINFKKS
jgi:mRNA interferase HigB